ncbi:extracellular solute-binding protein [Paenibacillus thiaminolyticus]|uniref:extracellular solute-binding protein n=1 Tax=Paenibacillus thiaminolyticus TaxID=49283 RepID=UPI0035A67E6C
MVKKWYKKSALILLTAVLMSTALLGCSSSTNKSSESDSLSDEDVTLTILHNWNGSSGADIDMTPVQEVIKEKTGVTVKFDYTKGSELEKINVMFATQNLPDIYTGPAWGGELDAIVKAAKEGQLVDVSDKLDQYPNLAKTIEKENVPESIYKNAIDAYDGKQYLLYHNYPATDQDIQDWLYGFYVRKDIADQIGVDPQSIKTVEDFYQFLKKIKDANLAVNGMPMIPLGGFSNGWAVNLTNSAFFPATYVDKGDGSFEHSFFTKSYEDYTLFNRKLIEEGLLDLEAFTQTDQIAKEKINQGRVAVLGAHFPAIYDATLDYAKAHPGAEFVPVGPLERAGAEPNQPADLSAQGSNVTVIPKTTKNVDAALKVLDFLASDEGFLLSVYGVEGVHWEMVDGKPKAKQEWFDKFANDPTGKVRQNEGIETGFRSISGLFRLGSVGNDDIYADPDRQQAIEETRKIFRPNGIHMVTEISPGDVIINSPQWETLKPSMDKIGDVWREAIYAKSDEDALKVINELRKQLINTGYNEAMEYVNQELKGKEVRRFQLDN